MSIRGDRNNHIYWETLSMFESRDYVEAWFHNRHGRQLNARGAQSINTCFIQGREYFDAAAVAATSVRPLLLYYGVLSTCRGLIMLRNPSKKEESLRQSHGLEAVDWGGTLSGGIDKLLNVRIRATNGTFGELVESVGNVQNTTWWSSPGMREGSYYAAFPRPAFADGAYELTLDDLISRDHRLLSLYPQTTKRTAKVHIGELVATKGRGVDVTLYGLSSTEDDIRNRFGQPANRAVNVALGRRLSIPGAHFLVDGPDLNVLKSELPLVQFSGNDGMFIVEAFPSGDRLSELLRSFLLSYMLGMLVRYHPSRWVALLRNEKGDAAQPCLKAVSRALADDFPRQIVEALS
ncbi:YaaC family protein [Rhodobacter sp. 24-YEA-8]|uniref:YaaC family protein n=1 Tax=Rhodobacter sp. 24-YEA-8 TaxID=1884310 RepID=UPI000894449C|nr:YaaC family protein [Rhodobacter sp. 24-YEA-8]SEC38493.1 YaaC-like Protein [Rhodobacter sp. 24-YEA-8]